MAQRSGGPGHPGHMALGPRHRQGDPRKVRPHLPGPAGPGPSVAHRGKSRQPVTLGGTQAQVSAELGPRLQTGESKSPDWVREVPPAWLGGQTPAWPQSGGGEQTPDFRAAGIQHTSRKGARGLVGRAQPFSLSLPVPQAFPRAPLQPASLSPSPCQRQDAGLQNGGPPPAPRPFSTARCLLSPQQ